MGLYDYLILFAVLVWLYASWRFAVRRRKQGKNMCGGNCGSCCANCRYKDGHGEDE